MTLTPSEIDDLAACRLADLLTEAEITDTPRHRWMLVRSQTPVWERTALRVAVHIAQLRCGGSPHLFTAWLNRIKGGDSHPPELHEVLVAQVASESIGTEEEPTPATHLEGFVAEHIWHALISELGGALGHAIRVEEPSWSVTDAGGDGLAVFQTGETFAFRLWESKSHTSDHPVRETVQRAGQQVTLRAMRYLARYSKVGQELDDVDLASFYGRLSELWRSADPASGFGVSVCTLPTVDITNPFDHLDGVGEFGDPTQREGLLVVVEDFAGFATRVREHLWNGL